MDLLAEAMDAVVAPCGLYNLIVFLFFPYGFPDPW